jgi:CDP-glycerol glycerophosphotransferase (TagB/SpsB family)
MRRSGALRVPVVSNLPGLDPKKPPPDPRLIAVPASLAATAVGLLAAFLGWPDRVWLAAAVVAVLPVALVVIHIRIIRHRQRQQIELLPAAMQGFAPEFVLYTPRPDDASYQVTMWLPYLKRTGLKFVVIARSGLAARALAELTDVPVLQVRSVAQLEALLVPSIRAAFYVNASSGNGELVRYRHLTHIYLGHGDSDKPPSYNPTHAMYDKVFAAGPAAIRRYAEHGVQITPGKFEVVGRPQVEGVAPAARPVRLEADPVVLYAPTWRGHVAETMLYSLPQGERIVQALLERGVTVIFRPHPFSYDFPEDVQYVAAIQHLLARDAQLTGRRHRWGAAAESELDIVDCINASNAMISDVSSVVSDYLYSDKPFAMVAVTGPPDQFVKDYPVARASYVVRADLADLNERLVDLLGEDPMAAQRSAIKVDYLGDFPAESYGAAFTDAVRRQVQRPEEREPVEDLTAEGESTDSPVSPPARSWWSQLRQGLGATGPELLGVLAAWSALAAALGSIEWLSVALAVLALGITLVDKRAAVVDRGRWAELLNRAAVARALLVVTVSVLAAAQGMSLVGVVLAAVLLALTVGAERYVRAVAAGPRSVVVDLPGTDPPRTSWLSAGSAPVAAFAAFLIAVVAVGSGLSGWVAVLVGALVVAADIVIFAISARNAGAPEEIDVRLQQALRDFDPRFAVYFSSTVGADYQVGMWLPYFLRIERPFVIITRTIAMTHEIAGLTRAAGVQVPIIYRPTLRSLEDVIMPAMATAFYVNNAARNTHFIERRELTHVWLNHGDSEKPACFNPVHAIYDVIFVAGQAGIDRYQRHGVSIPRAKFQIVGRPQVERIRSSTTSINEIAEPTVLYAPTWQGPYADSRVFSLPIGSTIIERLLDRGARVIFRAHPFNYRYRDCTELVNQIGRVLQADKAKTGRDHKWGPAAEQEMTIEDCFNASDAMIADVSAVVTDYLQSNKPFGIVSVSREPEQLLHDVPAAKAAYVLREDLSNLDETISNLLVDDPLADIRRETKAYYLGDFSSDGYADGFLNAARRVIDGNTKQHDSGVGASYRAEQGVQLG